MLKVTECHAKFMGCYWCTGVHKHVPLSLSKKLIEYKGKQRPGYGGVRNKQSGAFLGSSLGSSLKGFSLQLFSEMRRLSVASWSGSSSSGSGGSTSAWAGFIRSTMVSLKLTFIRHSGHNPTPCLAV